MNALPPVSRTAIGVARARAAEGRRPDALFDDPWADAFVAAAGGQATSADTARLTEEQRRWRAAIAFHVSIRTRFFDDYLTDALGGGVRQVVVLGAGLDTRAYRLGVPADVRWFELDLPEVLGFKQRVLDEQQATPRCHRSVVAADLAGDWSDGLLTAGLDPTSPTAWLAEGLLVYLDAATAAHVLATLTGLAAPGSRLAVERGDVAGQVAAMPSARRPDEASALWQGGLGRNPSEWLNAHGWQAVEHEVTDVATSYGRQPPPSARSGFVTATREL